MKAPPRAVRTVHDAPNLLSRGDSRLKAREGWPRSMAVALNMKEPLAWVIISLFSSKQRIMRSGAVVLLSISAVQGSESMGLCGPTFRIK